MSSAIDGRFLARDNDINFSVDSRFAPKQLPSRKTYQQHQYASQSRASMNNQRRSMSLNSRLLRQFQGQPAFLPPSGNHHYPTAPRSNSLNSRVMPSAPPAASARAKRMGPMRSSKVPAQMQTRIPANTKAIGHIHPQYAHMPPRRTSRSGPSSPVRHQPSQAHRPPPPLNLAHCTSKTRSLAPILQASAALQMTGPRRASSFATSVNEYYQNSAKEKSRKEINITKVAANDTLHFAVGLSKPEPVLKASNSSSSVCSSAGASSVMSDIQHDSRTAESSVNNSVESDINTHRVSSGNKLAKIDFSSMEEDPETFARKAEEIARLARAKADQQRLLKEQKLKEDQRIDQQKKMEQQKIKEQHLERARQELLLKKKEEEEKSRKLLELRAKQKAEAKIKREQEIAQKEAALKAHRERQDRERAEAVKRSQEKALHLKEQEERERLRKKQEQELLLKQQEEKLRLEKKQREDQLKEMRRKEQEEAELKLKAQKAAEKAAKKEAKLKAKKEAEIKEQAKAAIKAAKKAKFKQEQRSKFEKDQRAKFEYELKQKDKIENENSKDPQFPEKLSSNMPIVSIPAAYPDFEPVTLSDISQQKEAERKARKEAKRKERKERKAAEKQTVSQDLKSKSHSDPDEKQLKPNSKSKRQSHKRKNFNTNKQLPPPPPAPVSSTPSSVHEVSTAVAVPVGQPSVSLAPQKFRFINVDDPAADLHALRPPLDVSLGSKRPSVASCDTTNVLLETKQHYETIEVDVFGSPQVPNKRTSVIDTTTKNLFTDFDTMNPESDNLPKRKLTIRNNFYQIKEETSEGHRTDGETSSEEYNKFQGPIHKADSSRNLYHGYTGHNFGNSSEMVHEMGHITHNDNSVVESKDHEGAYEPSSEIEECQIRDNKTIAKLLKIKNEVSGIMFMSKSASLKKAEKPSAKKNFFNNESIKKFNISSMKLSKEKKAAAYVKFDDFVLAPPPSTTFGAVNSVADSTKTATMVDAANSPIRVPKAKQQSEQFFDSNGFLPRSSFILTPELKSCAVIESSPSFAEDGFDTELLTSFESFTFKDNNFIQESPSEITLAVPENSDIPQSKLADVKRMSSRRASRISRKRLSAVPIGAATPETIFDFDTNGLSYLQDYIQFKDLDNGEVDFTFDIPSEATIYEEENYDQIQSNAESPSSTYSSTSSSTCLSAPKSILKSALKNQKSNNNSKVSIDSGSTTVSFSNKVHVSKTYSKNTYDRQSDKNSTCYYLNPQMIASIKAELNLYKKVMPIHLDSLRNTHYLR